MDSLWAGHQAGAKDREGELPGPVLRNTPHAGMAVFRFCLNLTKVDQAPTVANEMGWVVLWVVRCRCEPELVFSLLAHRPVRESHDQTS